jgi:DNA-binding sugar fermentation-stimulating protein
MMLQVAILGSERDGVRRKHQLMQDWRWQGQDAQAAVPWQGSLTRITKTQSTRVVRSMANGKQKLFFTLVVSYPDHFSTVSVNILVLDSNVTNRLQTRGTRPS